jgi:hypothetical protein
MRNGILVLALAVTAGTAGSAMGQPKDGDLVLTITESRQYQYDSSRAAYLTPSSPGTINSLGNVFTRPNHLFGVRMAPDNTDLVMGVWSETLVQPASNLVELSPGGQTSWVCPWGLPGRPEDFEFDHDGTWTITINGWMNTLAVSLLAGVDHGRGSLVAYLAKLAPPYRFEELAIDRELHAGLYCLYSGGDFMWVDRQGTVASFGRSAIPGSSVGGMDLQGRTGDYLAFSWAPWGEYLYRVSKAGRSTLLGSFLALGYWRSAGVRILQDDTAWIGAANLLRFDLSTNTVTTLVKVSTPWGGFATGVEVYGWRRLVCHQPPSAPSVVTVNVQSRNPAAAGASYILAASPGRRPGLKLPNGEWLDLDVTHPLFLLTAQNLAPRMFVAFQGVLDQNGNNSKPIRVNIPPGLPKLSGMAIFVAGVIHKAGQVIQVTNSHWFVLP